MPLAPGQSLLHFRLVEKLGEGGMGEVWRAVDTTLDRDVAIKVLPAAFGSDPDRLARFEREAKVLASMNHANIAAIYGFPDGAPVRFLAMELVPGEDLAQILTRGRPLPIGEALDAARQVAAALEAAHDKGIIHRDLKPANVKRTPGGQIKVLDFGLAKALEITGANAGSSATVTSAGSQMGMILGTASYMSPEQARGQAVDRRTDLWAFGCLVYEMLTGTKAFDGATVTDVLAAVVTGEPDWSKLPAETPASVRRLLRRCLEKDVRKRLRDAGDASLLLDDGPEDARTMPVPKAVPAKRSLALPIGAALVAAAGLVGGWFLSQRGGAPAAAAPVTFNRLTFAKGMMRSARFAPDGKTIVYGAAWNGPPIKLYLTRTDSKESAPIPAPPAELFSISKSGEMAVGVDYRFYGWMGEGTLARTSLLGGTPREVANNVRDADWSPDGSQLAVVRRVEGFDQLEYPVGKVLDKTVGYFGSIRISPDGERIAYSDHPVWGDNVGDIAVVDRNGEKTRLAGGFAGVEGVAWAPGGREVWFTGTSEGEMNLYAVDLSGARRVIYSSIDAIELFDIAPDGRALLGRQRNDRSTIALLAGDAEPRTIVVPGEASVARAMTPDGRALAVASHLTQKYDTFLIRADRPGAVRLSDGDSHALSWDGAWSLTAPADNDSTHVTPTGQGPTRAIPNPDGVSYLTIAAFLPDGKRFLSTGRKGSGPQLGWVFDVETGKATPFTTEEVRWPSFVVPPVAPDGSEVILRAADGTPKRWPLAGGSPRPIPGILPDDQPLTFTEDGRAIFVAGRTLPVSIERLDLSSGRRTPWLTLVPENPAGMRYSIPTLTPDGKHWALCTAKLFTDLFVVTGLR